MEWTYLPTLLKYPNINALTAESNQSDIIYTYPYEKELKC